MDSKLRVLITAGPTHEPIDAVRYVANRSSGRMGVALAEAFLLGGFEVRLLLGPTVVGLGEGLKDEAALERFETAADLEGLLDRYFDESDILVMAAAVADYRPALGSSGLQSKIRRSKGGMRLELEATPDLVAGCAERKREGQRVIGFALEAPEELMEGAKDKLWRKKLDAVVANPLKTMGDVEIDATVYSASGAVHRVGEQTKAGFAKWLVEQVKGEGIY